MAGGVRVAVEILGRRDEIGGRQAGADASAALDHGPAGEAEKGGDAVPVGALGAEAADLGVLGVGPGEFLGHGASG